MPWHADGRIWVTDWNGPRHLVDPGGGHLWTLRLGREAHHLALTPDGSRLWLVDHATRRAYVIDTGAVEVDEVGLPAPYTTPRSRRRGAGGDRGPTSGTVVAHTRTRERVAEIPVGAGPHGVWEVPGG